MKKIITLTLLFFSLLSYCQQMNLDKGKFYFNGKPIDNREAKNLFATNVKAATLFKQAKSKEALGSFLLGFGLVATTIDLSIGLFSDEVYPSHWTYIGIGSIAVSIPILSGRKKRYVEAVKIYNSEHTELKLGASNYNSELNAISNQNGFGFQLKF